MNALRLELIEPGDGIISDADFIAAWLRPKAMRTAEAYRHQVSHFRRWCRKPLAAVTFQDVQEYLIARSEDGYAPNSVQLAKTVVCALLNYAHALGHIPHKLPLGLLVVPVTPAPATDHCLTPEEVQQLIRHASRQGRLAITLMYYTGMRVSEAIALTWGDLQHDGANGWAVIQHGKGDKRRMAGLPAWLWDILAVLRQGEADTCRVLGIADRRKFHTLIQEAARRAGLSVAPSSHWLRHSHITHAIQAGCPWEEVAEQAGHDSVATTHKVYAHLRRDKRSSDYLGGGDK